MKVSSVKEMRELDRTAVEKYLIEDKLLMENAGEAAYFVISQEFGIRGRKFVVFCGIGNNGGDGFVIARKIHSNGGTVKVFIAGDQENFQGSARMNLDIISRMPIEIRQVDDPGSVKSEVLHCDCIVDAIFGTGLTRAVEGIHKDIIHLINESGKPVVSVDIPSGVNGDTGKTMGAAVGADFTVTFGLPKRGNMLFPGYELCGSLYVTHISFPPEHYDADSIKVSLNEPPELPPRDRDGHKGDFGEALFIAGAAGYFGAPYFAALSFLKAGGGYSRLASPRSITPFIANKSSEIVFIPQTETASGSIAKDNKDALVELSSKMDIVVLGPGLSLDEETQELARLLAKEIRQPLLIDGDGITALSRNLNIIKEREAPTILTPHLGEMSRITGLKVADIDGDEIPVLQRTSRELNSIIVLKGAHSLIGYPDERVLINMTGNSGMATAGSGDVLTGTIAAMFGLGLSIEDAVAKGLYIHGLSGDIASKDIGEDGITAQDILDYLSLAIKIDREKTIEEYDTKYEEIKIV
jgi:hydroxyethylthiazole kinase-like uncharacterized protein yjeF